VPLEGAEQGAEGGAVHGQHDGTGMRSSCVMRPSGRILDTKMTSVAAGQWWCGGPART
jgi:hypothetical protein